MMKIFQIPFPPPVSKYTVYTSQHYRYVYVWRLKSLYLQQRMLLFMPQVFHLKIHSIIENLAKDL